jgi:hypothetical protein
MILDLTNQRIVGRPKRYFAEDKCIVWDYYALFESVLRRHVGSYAY